MRKLHTFLASSLVLTLVNLASSQTVVRITGSSAYRMAVYQAITDILAPGFVFGYTGSTASRASQSIYFGQTKTGAIPVIIKTSFFGSIGGIATLASNLTVGPGGSFTGGGGWLVDATPQSVSGTPNAPANYDNPVTADVTLSDCYQASAPAIYHTPALYDNVVGVVPFIFVLTPGQPLSNPSQLVVNITSRQVTKALVNGTLKLKNLSGDFRDTESVLAVGGDEDSGIRLQALVCSGISRQTPLRQYQPLFDGQAVPTNPPPAPGRQITGAALWPARTLNGVSYPVGDSGYNTGGSLAGVINVPHQGGGFPLYANWFLSYVGIYETLPSNAIQLEFNGAPYNPANVEGPGATGFRIQYTLWGYEHLMYRKTLTGNVKTVADQIANDIRYVSFSASGIGLDSMVVSRDKDGGPIESHGTPGN